MVCQFEAWALAGCRDGMTFGYLRGRTGRELLTLVLSQFGDRWPSAGRIIENRGLHAADYF
jgi:hypothetical protein